MRLGVRLFLSLMAAAVVGGSLLFVVYVFWNQGIEQSKQQLEAELTMRHVELKLIQGEDPWLMFAGSSLYKGMSLTLVDVEGKVRSSQKAHTPTSCVTEHRESTPEYEHWVSPLEGAGNWVCLVVSRHREAAYGAMYRRWLEGATWIALAMLLAALLGYLFSRHIIARPISRLTELVRAGDPGELSTFEAQEPDELSHLSRSIIGMSQRIGDDRGRLAEQLLGLQQAHNELKQAQDQLVRAERLAVVGQLAAGVAHEVGNPLSIIGGYIDMLESGELREEDKARALGSVNRELDRINRTIRELLDFSRASPGTEETGDLSAALAHVRELLRPQALFRELELSFPEDTAHWGALPIATDRIVQVLLNLLLNAAEAMGGKGKIEFTAEFSPERTVLRIEDSGPGIEEESRERLFEPFFTTRPAGEGTGLGLAVCEQIVNSANGTIRWVPSRLGGAGFEVCFTTQVLAEA